ncbi:5'-nucleotidase, lipoprotein e(P4) family [Tenuifilum thalassicum]|uniref:5'-nucleotidase, lipoprotein e(P4) family n=1 Tax=Tenuifilum thalassicum TaxID=2590900 RepID=A0A7D3XMH3_9BACT|nr:5'-nucleotidase, lipoprotein e(P4) family [Tenuifilum thalassicum]QKG81135.1 5'-nucleotidase, lipoprotein e(P4) family [Tenuifilum thalassicum]
MKIKNLLAIAVAFTFLASCANRSKEEKYNHDYLMYATIWYQNSPEMKALYYQGFNIAGERLKQFSKMKTAKPKAVVVDIDETMLNNSPFQAQEIIDNKGYSKEFWNEWCKLAKAEATPGAVEFSKLCDSLGITLFYISNRSVTQFDATLRNLDSLGFAYAKPEYLILKDAESSKKARRAKVTENYEIVLLIGDNLDDFSEIFENRASQWGTKTVDEFKKEFGNRYIILPNPMYGSWEKNIYTKQDTLPAQRDSARRSVLKGFSL